MSPEESLFFPQEENSKTIEAVAPKKFFSQNSISYFYGKKIAFFLLYEEKVYNFSYFCTHYGSHFIQILT